jgi:hypothetical protein
LPFVPSLSVNVVSQMSPSRSTSTVRSRLYVPWKDSLVIVRPLGEADDVGRVFLGVTEPEQLPLVPPQVGQSQLPLFR